MEEMMTLEKQHNKLINRGIYFNKAIMDDIMKLIFYPGNPSIYLNTAEHGISLIICQPLLGKETSDIQSKEQAMSQTTQNHTPTLT